MKDRLISLKEAAQILCLSLRAIYRLIANGELPKPVRIGRSSRLYESDLQKYLETLKQQRG